MTHSNDRVWAMRCICARENHTHAHRETERRGECIRMCCKTLSRDVGGGIERKAPAIGVHWLEVIVWKCIGHPEQRQNFTQ